MTQITTPGTFQGVLQVASVVPVITSGGALNSGTSSGGLLQSGQVVVGILDPMSTQRLFNPYAEGLSPVSGTDTLTDWLPSFNTAGIFGGITAASIDDQYWGAVARDMNGEIHDGTANTKVGQVTLYLKPGAYNTVEAASVMTFKVSPEAAILLAPGADTF